MLAIGKKMKGTLEKIHAGLRICFLSACIPGLALAVWPARARAQPDGGLPGSFSREGVGARALGLAGSFAGIADDASAIYWNPAGLSLLGKPELTLNHITLFSGTSSDFIGFGLPLKRLGALGAGYLRQTSGGFQKRETPFDTPTSFDIANSMLQLGWAIGVPAEYTPDILRGKVSLGFGVKSVAQRVAAAGGSGTGADAGLLYRHDKGFFVGIAVQNIMSPSITLVSKNVSFPRVVDVAPAYTRGLGKDLKVSLAARTNHYGGRFHPAGGLELRYLGKFAFRSGLEAKGISLGAGAQLANYQFDYAVLLHELAPSHIISFSLKFGMTGLERAEEIRRGMKKLDQEEGKRLARSYYLEGLNSAKEGNLPAAIGNLEKSDLLDPANRQVEGKLKEFRAEYALQLNRQMAETSVILARQQYQQGNILISLEYWKAALQVDPGSEEARLAIETIKSRLGSQETEMLARAQRDIVDVQVSQFLTKAQKLREQGLLAESADEARKALAADGGNERARTLIAELDQAIHEKVEQLSRKAALEDERKDFKASVAAYQAILQVAPAAPGIGEKLKTARAAVSIKVKPALKKEAERLYYVAVDQYLKKQYQESAKTLARILELDPGSEGASKLKAKLEATLK
ncbi:MAG: hypothetical protein A2X31_04410 [Elusimicrobia bacterium GWB2_63_22]|nr:MAG: hypothetical protein A2X31_04410 [Elusimicrobia bacterium GWB2_63_22]